MNTPCKYAVVFAFVLFSVVFTQFAAVAGTAAELEKQFPQYSIYTAAEGHLSSDGFLYIAAFVYEKNDTFKRISLFRRYPNGKFQLLEQSEYVVPGKQIESLTIKNKAIIYSVETGACCDKTNDKYYFKLTKRGAMLYKNSLEYIRYGSLKPIIQMRTKCENDFIANTGFIEESTQSKQTLKKYKLAAPKILPLSEFELPPIKRTA